MYQHYQNSRAQSDAEAYGRHASSQPAQPVGYAPYSPHEQPAQQSYDPRSQYRRPTDINSIRRGIYTAYQEVMRFVTDNFNDPANNARAGDDIRIHLERVIDPAIDHMLSRWEEFQALGGAIGESYMQTMGYSIAANAALEYIDGNQQFRDYVVSRFDQAYGKLDMFVRPLEDVIRRANHQYGNAGAYGGHSQPAQPRPAAYATPPSSRIQYGQGNADNPMVVSGDPTRPTAQQQNEGGGHRSGLMAGVTRAKTTQSEPVYQQPPQSEPKQQYFGGASTRKPTPVQQPTAPAEQTIARPRADFTRQPTVSHEPVQHGKDPAFNMALDMMRRTAGGPTADETMQQQPLMDIPPLSDDEIIMQHRYDDSLDDPTLTQGMYHEPDDGIVEDFNDYTFDPLAADNTATQISEFVYRLAHGGSVAGWSFYDPKQPGDARYPVERPFPVVYNALTHVKFTLVNKDNRIIEIIKEKDADMEMQDHIDDDLSVATKGHRVNILEVLNQTATRMNVSENRKEVKENKAKGVDAVVATADRKAFDNKVISTTSNAVADMLVQRLADVRDVTIEGYHERRLTPIYVGEEGVKNLESFQHTVGAAATFKAFAEMIPRAMSDLPEAFVTEYTARLTAFFNDFLTTRLGVDFWTENFFEDFSDAYEEAGNLLGERIAADKFHEEFKRFAKFAKVMPRSTDGYPDVLGTALTQPGFVAFATTITTVTLPFTSEEGKDILPVDGAAYQGVESTHTPELFKVLKTLLRSGQETFNGEANVTRVITKDGKVYYVQTGAFSVEGDALVMAQKSYLINHLS